MAVMVTLYTTVLSTKMRNADGRSGHGGREAEGQWIIDNTSKKNHSGAFDTLIQNRSPNPC